METNELGRTIVKGQVANYSMSVANNNHITFEELADILRDIAALLTGNALTEKEEQLVGAFTHLGTEHGE